jgi:hypothetical protein
MSEKAHTPTSTYDDGEFERTSLVIGTGENHGSVDIVSARTGKRVAQLNLYVYGDDQLIVDVIDLEERLSQRSAFGFSRSQGRFSLALPPDASLVSVDFRHADDE